MSLFERFQRKVLPLTNGCWMWGASFDLGGYGQINTGTTMGKAHRVAYELYVGPIPTGLDIDHLCRNRWCVNPEHLEAVTRGENIRRAWPFRNRPERCPADHPFDEDNTAYRQNGSRVCRICRNNASRASKARARARAAASSPNPTPMKG